MIQRHRTDRAWRGAQPLHTAVKEVVPVEWSLRQTAVRGCGGGGGGGGSGSGGGGVYSPDRF